MREFNALEGYPEPTTPRVVGPGVRTIQNRIVASYRGKEFYDGDRNNGYGGFTYDGRWVPIAKFMAQEYGLTAASAVLQINCEKGFLLHDFQQLFPGITVYGVEISDYAIATAMPSVRSSIQKAPFTQLPFANQTFDFVIAIGAVYALTLTDAITCLKEIQRVGKGKGFVTLASYDTEEDKRLFEWWTLLGTTILRKDEWVEVLTHVGYTGDYKFTNARGLKLVDLEAHRGGESSSRRSVVRTS
jgi:hypothetical protein